MISRFRGCRSRRESIFGFAAALLMRCATKQLPCDYIMHTHTHIIVFTRGRSHSIRQNWIPWFNQIWRGANYLARRENAAWVNFISLPRSPILHPSIISLSPHLLHAVYRYLMNSRPRFEEIFSTLIWPPHNDNCCLPEYTKNKKLLLLSVGWSAGMNLSGRRAAPAESRLARFSNIHNYVSRVDHPTRGQFCDL